MSATPIFCYDTVRRLLESGATNAQIAERIGCRPKYVAALVRKVKAERVAAAPRKHRTTEANLFLDEDALAKRLRKSCEAATAALMAAYPDHVTVRS